MALPSSWTTVDPAAWAADEPLPSALLQQGAINGRYLNIEHTRSATIGYDNAWRPIMCGAIPPGDTESSFERVCIPYLWDPRGASTVTVTVSVEMFIPSGTGSFVLNAHWQEITDFTDRAVRTRAVPTINSGSNATISAIGNSIETLTLNLSSRVNVARSGPIIIWLVGTSSETSTPAVFGTLNSINQILCRSAEVTTGSGNISNDTQPERVLYFYSTNAAGKEDTVLPNRRQVIRQEVGQADDTGDDIVYIWPPYADSNSVTNGLVLSQSLGDPTPAFVELTSLKIHGVSFTDVTEELAEYGTMLDAGQGPGSRAIRYLYSLSTAPWMDRTPVHAIGAVADMSKLDDYDTTTPISQVFPSVLVTDTYQAIASAYLQHRDVFQAPGSTSDVTRVGIRVRALVVLELDSSEIRPMVPAFDEQSLNLLGSLGGFDVSFSLLAESETGGSQTAGGDQVFPMTPIGYSSNPRAGGNDINRCAAMLDLKRAMSSATLGWKGTDRENHAHTLFGALPESSWADCITTLVDLYVEDATVSQRVITMQCRIDGTIHPGTRIHLLSWLVTHTENTAEVAVVGV